MNTDANKRRDADNAPVRDERPMLFSGAMVRAILGAGGAGQLKTQTRRVLKTQPSEDWHPSNYGEVHRMVNGRFVMRRGAPVPIGWGPCNASGEEAYVCNYGKPGERLWVKETWGFEDREIFYRADSTSISGDWKGLHPDLLKAFEKDKSGTISKYAVPTPFEKPPQKWKPSIFMSHWASRITLEIEAVRVERLQDISEEDAMAEGIPTDIETIRRNNYSPIKAYRELWNSINLKPSANYVTGEDGKKVIVSYQCFPWSHADFDVKYPGVRETGLYRGKPIVVTENPWVWVIQFKKF